MKHWSVRPELSAKTLLGWLELSTSKYHQWKDRYGKANEHNGQVRRDWWLEEARCKVASYVEHYNQVRLHSAIGYVTPGDKLAGLEDVIFAQRDRKLDEARERCKAARKVACSGASR